MEKTKFSDLVCVVTTNQQLGISQRSQIAGWSSSSSSRSRRAPYEAPIRREQELSDQQELFYQQEADNGAGLDHDFHSDIDELYKGVVLICHLFVNIARKPLAFSYMYPILIPI